MSQRRLTRADAAAFDGTGEEQMKIDASSPESRPRLTGKEPAPLAADAKRLLRSLMQRRGFTFKSLAAAMEVDEEEPVASVQTLINKVNRGRFSFAFFLRATRAMGASTIDVSAVDGPESATADQ